MYNPCVYTGIYFLDLDSGKVGTADLYHDGAQWQLRGMPKEHPIDADLVRIPPAIAISHLEIWPRPKGYRHADSAPGIWLEWLTPGFVEHIQQWYPHLVDRLGGLPVTEDLVTVRKDALWLAKVAS